MKITARNKQSEDFWSRKDILGMLDRGISDMESKRELPVEEAFQKITELRNVRRNAKV